jgi:hypothetical protein
MAGHPASHHDCRRQHHPLSCCLVDLAISAPRNSTATAPPPPQKQITLILSSSLIPHPFLLSLPMPSKETLFAVSLFPYLGFLWFLTRSGQTPRLALIGFYMTLVFVAVTIPIGIYAQVAYGESLANVDFLHGGAEVFLTLSNVLVLLGFRQAIQQKQRTIENQSKKDSENQADTGAADVG